MSKLTDCIAVFPIEIFGDNITIATEIIVGQYFIMRAMNHWRLYFT